MSNITYTKVSVSALFDKYFTMFTNITNFYNSPVVFDFLSGDIFFLDWARLVVVRRLFPVVLLSYHRHSRLLHHGGFLHFLSYTWGES